MKAQALTPTVAKLGRASSRSAASVGRWIDAGRSSVILALAIAVVLPSANFVPFDGLPLDRPLELVALAALLPFVFSASLRGRIGELLRLRAPWGPRVALGFAWAAIALKIALGIWGSDVGFAACYSSTWKPASDRCEKSYANPFGRGGGATRIDQRIDFGPTSGTASSLVTSYTTLTYARGIAATDWNLSFANDLRFNQGRQSGLSLHELMPFAVHWQGTAQVPADGQVRIRYRGSGSFEIGGKRIRLPAAETSRTILARVPPGEQPLSGRFRSPARVEGPEVRLLDQDGDPISAAGPSVAETLAAWAIALVLGAAFLALIAVAGAALGSDLWLLALVVLAALAVAALSSPTQHFGFQYLAAVLAPIMLFRLPRRPILWAFAALLVVEGAAVLNSVSDLHAVLYRASGTDFLTYESYARRIVLDGALNGGENVFFYQPGSRYTTGLMHLLFGDGDVLITWWWMVVVSLPFMALLAWNRRRARSSLAVLAGAAIGFLILALLNSQTIVSLVAMEASEVPTWALLPWALAAPQLQPRRAAAWAGSAAAASLMYLMRTNQALAVVTILAAIAAALWRRRRPLLWAIAGVAAIVLLLPTLHNLVFGGRLVLTTTSAALTQEVGVGQLFHVFSSDHLGGLIRGHLSAILYDPPTEGLTHATLAWLLWALLGAWLLAVGVGISRLRRRSASLSECLLLLLPVAYLFPHLLYQVEVYFPRHIIAGYLAMGGSAIGVLSTVGEGAAWARVPAPVLAAASSISLGVKRAPGRLAKGFGAVARALPVRALTTNFGISRMGVVLAAGLAPFSATRIAGPLTVGRLAVLVLAAALAFDLLRERPRLPRPSAPALMLVASYLGLAAWILLSSRTWGCNCDGKAGGFFEFAAVGLLALVAIAFEPKLREAALLGTLAGLGLAALLALLGVGALNSGTVDLTQTGGRLSGTYGNANELGFVMAMGLPIAAAFALAAADRVRLLFAALFALLGVALLLSFSRGGIIAAGLGVVAVGLWSARGSRRAVVAILAGAGAAALLAAAFYSVFQEQRQDVSFSAVPVALRPLDQHDLSGWEARAIGPIPSGASALRNRPGGFLVRGGGASYEWGEAARGGSYVLRFSARSAGRDRVPVSFALGDAVRGDGPERATVLGSQPRTYELAWRPRRRAPHATLYVWPRAPAHAAFVLSDVSVRARAPGGRAHAIEVPDRLRGSTYAHLVAGAEHGEDRYVNSRLEGSRIALDAFVANPLKGIGWATFPDYADEHLDYGKLAAHDQYLSFAAELGIVGLLLFALLVAAAVGGVRGSDDGVAKTAAIGVLVAAAAGLVFVEALPVPQLSIPVALALAVVCARGAPARSAKP